jgi:chromosome partitioning protein
MRRIAIINQKGGVGKTTTTANLGAAIAQRGQRVLLIDLDPQGHLTLHFGGEVGDEQNSIYDVLTASTPLADAILNLRENVDVVPADIDLAGAEAELVSVMGREVLLREALDAYGNAADVLLIDCPPSLGVLTINALVACDEVIIPLQAHFFGLQGLGKLLETVSLVRQRVNPKIRVSGIALCMHDATTKLAGEVTDDIRGFLEGARGTDQPWADAKLYDTVIRRNIKLAESCSFGQTVFDYAPTSNGAADYAALAKEVLEISPAGADQPAQAEEDDTSQVARAADLVPSGGNGRVAAEDAPQAPRVAPTPARPAPKRKRAAKSSSSGKQAKSHSAPGAEVRANATNDPVSVSDSIATPG